MRRGTSGRPRYVEVREQMRERIASGSLRPGTRLPPETELFRALGASNTTVVRALNDLVREGLIVRRRGSGTFVAERGHPPLIPGRHLRLGILWYTSVRASEWNCFCHRLSLGALDAWGMGDVEPELDEDRAGTYTRAAWRHPARGATVECLGNEWGGQNRTPSLEAVRDAGFDGILTLGIIEEKWLEGLLALGKPTVIVDFPTQRFATQADVVYADPQSGYRAAVDHFAAMGMRRIHFVGYKVWDPHTRIPDSTRPAGFRYGRRVDPDSYLRVSAYRQAMDANGIGVPEAWVHQTCDDNATLAPELASLPEAERPDAVVCNDADQAENLIRECGLLGLEIEGAGACDKPRVGRALNIRLDAREMGAVAGERLLARLKRPGRPFLNIGVRMVFAPPDARVPQAAKPSAGEE